MTTGTRATGDFDLALGTLLEPALAGLAAQLGAIPGLDDDERSAICQGTAVTLYETVHRKVSRVLLIELNGARISGTLTAADPVTRFQEWLARAAEPSFWEALSDHYPPLLTRLSVVIANRCAAAVTLARRFSADRAELATLLGTQPGALSEVEFGAGDSHRGGQTVAILRCAAGRIVYKPRSVDIDGVLARLLRRVLPDEPDDTRIRVPQVLVRDGYGWAEHVEHRYCADDADLRAFYRGIGHWLAMMRLLGGSDLHSENLIAVGPVPTVVDCETLFTPVYEAAGPSGYGLAIDRAVALVDGTVLRTGLLPSRGLALGWRGVDTSALGSLPGQQPSPPLPVIVDGGTDMARFGTAQLPIPLAGNHPSEQPVLGQYWQLVHSGFVELTQQLRVIDRDSQLEPMLAEFAGCTVRVVARGTDIYAELGRMLWHPTSLHDEQAACRRAAELLAKQAVNLSGPPGDPAVIDAEIRELLNDDVPFFTTTPSRGRLDGPGGTEWGASQDVLADTVRRWRDNDLDLDRKVTQAALVSAYLNEGWVPDFQRMPTTRVRTDDLDRRRRTQAAGIVRAIADAALRAEDGSVTWIAPVLNPTGWTVQPLGSDVYAGAAGVAILFAAYLTEVRHGRADEVTGLDSLLADLLHTMRARQDQMDRERAATPGIRPEPPGGYVGLGSQIWAGLLLNRFAAADSESIERTCALAEQLTDAIAADESVDVLLGAAGAIVPLLRLAECTGDDQWSTLAGRIGRRIVVAGTLSDATACWPSSSFPTGIGGFAHGATGIGWALARLGSVSEDPVFARCADAAFDYEESLYDSELRGWRDLRVPGTATAAWCHGSGGIGIAAADLMHSNKQRPWRDVLRRAAASCWESGMGWNHTLCHGDLGNWEVLDLALAAGVGPPDLDQATLDGQVVSSLEEYGPVSGLARDAFSPGLIAGLGGIAYQLLRMHPESRLPSVLLPDPGPLVP